MDTDGIANPYHHAEGEKLRVFAVSKDLDLEAKELTHTFTDINTMGLEFQTPKTSPIFNLLSEYVNQFNHDGTWKD